MPFKRSAPVLMAVLAGSLALAGCGHTSGPKTLDGGKRGILHPFGGGAPKSSAPAASIGVNGYLWRATLDTLAFMPLASADPYGGVIITDWYSNPEKPDERFKATVYILDTRLRADGLKVSIFKQVKQGDAWVDQDSAVQTETDIENAILTRARQLRLSNLNGKG